MTENLLCGHCQVLKYINVIIYFTETKWWNYLIASRTTELQQAEVIIFCMTLSASHIVTHIEEFWLTLLFTVWLQFVELWDFVYSISIDLMSGISL